MKWGMSLLRAVMRVSLALSVFRLLGLPLAYSACVESGGDELCGQSTATAWDYSISAISERRASQQYFAGQVVRGNACAKTSVDSQPVLGNPVRVLIGEKIHREAVIENTDCAFDLYYSSRGYFRPIFESAEVEVGIGDFWSHTFASRLYIYSSTAFPSSRVSAIAIRPDMTLILPGTDGLEIGARSGSKYRLARVFSAGVLTGYRLLRPDDGVEEYDLAGKLLQVSEVSGKVDRLARIAGVDRLHARALQRERDHVANRRFVLDDQNPFLHDRLCCWRMTEILHCGFVRKYDTAAG